MNSVDTITCWILCCPQREATLFHTLDYSVFQGPVEVQWLNSWEQVALYPRIIYQVPLNFITGENHRLPPYWAALGNQR